MNKIFYFTLISLCANANTRTFTDFDEIFEKMDERFEKMHKEMEEDMNEMFAMKIDAKEIVTITQKDNSAIITIDLPGMKNLDAQIEEGVLRIVDLDNKKNIVEVVVQDLLVHLDIHYEYRDEKEDKDGKAKASHYTYFHSSPTLVLPARIDLSKPESINIQYEDGKLTISAPMIIKPVQKITVQTPSKPTTVTTTATATPNEKNKEEKIKEKAEKEKKEVA